MKNNMGVSTMVLFLKSPIYLLNMPKPLTFFIFEDLKICVVPAILKLKQLQTLVLKNGQV